MNSFSDVVGRKQTPQADTASPFLLRKAEPSKSVTAELAPQESGTEGDDKSKSAIADSLIQGLIQRLPKPDTSWSLDDRVKWLKTADSIFGLVYKAGGRRGPQRNQDLGRRAEDMLRTAGNLKKFSGVPDAG